MTKKLSEVAAWKSLATTFDNVATGKRRVRTVAGLCLALLTEVNTSWRTLDAMRKRMHAKQPRGTGSVYWWPKTRAGAAKRAAFCKRMARLAEADNE